MFDRFAICAAYNVYSMLWGWDEYTYGIQSRLTRINYRPSASDQTARTLDETAQDILFALVERREGRKAALDLALESGWEGFEESEANT